MSDHTSAKFEIRTVVIVTDVGRPFDVVYAEQQLDGWEPFQVERLEHRDNTILLGVKSNYESAYRVYLKRLR